MSPGWRLAQLNIGRVKAPVDAPELRDFMDNLDRINALAEAIDRLRTLERLGPSARAFTFKSPFAAPDAAAAPLPVLEECA